MKPSHGSNLGAVGAIFVLLAGAPTLAAPFSSPNNLVVIRVGSDAETPDFNIASSAHLEEYSNLSGATANLVQTINLPATGQSAVTLPFSSNHDGILNRSVDGRYLVFGGYRADSGTSDLPMTNSDPLMGPATPRVVVRVDANGAVDSSTALMDGSYNQTSIRAVATDDGSRFWVAGDNAGNEPCCSISGGLRYVASLGASTSVNLSSVQESGGAQTPDNVRDVGIFDGQLYDSSGSNSSIGKSTFIVGSGLPTATVDTPQALTKLYNDGASTSAFFFLDLSNAVPGVDTLYTSASAQGEGLHKYAKTACNGALDCYQDTNGAMVHWVSNGFVALPAIEAITGSANGSAVTIYSTDKTSVYRLTDSTGYNATIGGSMSAPIITVDENESIRGLAFAPSSTVVAGDYNHNGIVDAADYNVWRDHLGQHVTPGTGADGVADGAHRHRRLQLLENKLRAHVGVGCRCGQ